MGTYLSTPVTEKCHESGESKDANLAWGVVDMQGWRKSMEDGHVAHLTETSQVFGVFDGHGGPEVARFCSLYLVSVLQQQATFAAGEVEAAVEKSESTCTADIAEDDENAGLSRHKETNMGKALVSAFHALDRMIDSSQRR